MSSLTSQERAALEIAADAPMLAQVEDWAAVNSGTGNLAGLDLVSRKLANAFAALPGTIRLVEAEPVEAVLADGSVKAIERGKHLHLAVRPEAPVRVLLTGHMDTVFAVDHPFQSLRWLEAGVLNGPGTADMKGGLSVILAALGALEASPWAGRIGYDVLINSDEETGSHASARLIAELAKGKIAALTYEPALPDGTLAGADIDMLSCVRYVHEKLGQPLEEALRMAGGKKVKAAEILGISRFALLRRVEKYGLG